MKTHGMKSFTLAVIAAFLYSCAKPPLALSPDEIQKLKIGTKVAVETMDGRTTTVRYPKIEGRMLVGEVKRGDRIEIDFSSIKSVKTKRSHTDLIMIYGASAVVLGLLIHGANTAPSPPGSCPYVYSFDGESYHFDAEPFGAAVSEGMKRAEWSVMERLVETNGTYRLLVANELQETEHIDEIRLLVADHPAGLKVVPDATGGIHALSSPRPPRTARDSRGNDIAGRLSSADGDFWQTDLERVDPAAPETLRDELTLEFPKPAGAHHAKLLVNATTSLWGATIGKRFLELHGESLPGWYAEVDRHGPAFFETMAWHLREEMYLLQIRVLTENGWRIKGTLLGGGPLAFKDKVYLLDISDVPGDTLTIRLTPPANFWSIDQLAVDYSDNAPVSVVELETSRATDREGRDVAAPLKTTDGSYLVMPRAGDSAELTFAAPPKTPGTERTIILKACGYYEHHIDMAGAQPRPDILQAFADEPGSAIRFALAEYLEWKAEQDANLRAHRKQRN